MRLWLLLMFCCVAASPLVAGAQQDSTSASVPVSPVASTGTLSGVVTDPSGATVEGALVTVTGAAIKQAHSTHTGEDGRFTFVDLEAGVLSVSVEAAGLQPFTGPAVLHDGERLDLPVTLRIATTNTDVEVRLTQTEIAEEDIHVEEKQRLAGFVPNFYVVYDWKAPPLNTRQKYKLAFRTVIDPASFVIVGGIAGIEQATDTFPGYYQGAMGYAKRYGAGWADFSIGTVLGGAVLPELFKQDPRYFYKGTGTTRSRVLYALSTGFIARGDNGKWQPAYASILGDFASGAISNIYYPASNRTGATVTITNGLIGIVSNSVGNLVQEFVFKKVTPGSRKDPADMH